MAGVTRPPLSLREAAAHMGVSLQTLRWWRAHEGLPFHRLPGGKTLYSPDELAAWLRWRDVIDPPTGPPPPRIPRYRRRT